MGLLNSLCRRSSLLLYTLGIVLVVLVGALDYVTGEELSVSIFYLVPVAMCAWCAGRRAGVWISAASAVVWFLADYFTFHQYAHELIRYWNAVVGFGFSLIVAYSLAALHEALILQEQLSQFIVHDLRSPLTNVITGLQTLQGMHTDETPDVEKELVDMAVISADRQLTLINSLLDLPRIESGKMPMDRQVVEVSVLAEETTAQLTLWASQNNVSLKCSIDPEAKSVFADHVLTGRVLTNLVSNALKFSPAGSTITIASEPFEGGKVLLSVRDQGPGIPKKWADKVFDKFSQVEARTAGAAVGTGLGLTFCRMAVEAQGGRIWLESKEGEGTVFKFTLPSGASVTVLA